MTDRKEFAFDIKLLAAVRVQAASEDEARAALHALLDCVDIGTQYTHPGSGAEVRLTEASIDGSAKLFEVDGEDVDDLPVAVEVDPNDERFRYAAIVNYVSDKIEIDGDATVSASDKGAFVAAWVWVSNSDAGIEGGDDDDGDEDRCSNPGGHEWPRDIEESERCLCVHCGADGDA